jgi:hypothetical protein
LYVALEAAQSVRPRRGREQHETARHGDGERRDRDAAARDAAADERDYEREGETNAREVDTRACAI